MSRYRAPVVFGESVDDTFHLKRAMARTVIFASQLERALDTFVSLGLS